MGKITIKKIEHREYNRCTKEHSIGNKLVITYTDENACGGYRDTFHTFEVMNRWVRFKHVYKNRILKDETFKLQSDPFYTMYGELLTDLEVFRMAMLVFKKKVLFYEHNQFFLNDL